MIGLYTLKPRLQHRLEPLARFLHGRRVTPDAVTTAGLVFAGLSGGAIWASAHSRLWLTLVPTAGALRILANALDGMLARRRASTKAAGEVWNEMADRFGDLLMIVPMATVDGVLSVLVFGATIASLLSSHVAVAVRAATGCPRPRNGWMGKPDRVAVVGVGALVALVAPVSVVLNSVLVVVGVGSIHSLCSRWISQQAA